MKYLLALSISILSMSILYAQSGTIKYEENRQFKIELPEGQEHLADILPSFHKSVLQLTFTPKESSFVEITEDQEHSIENETAGGMMKIQMKKSASKANYYKNLDKNTSIQKKDLMGKYFIIEEEIETPKWKILNEQKQILDYICMKASMESEEGVTTAWFTPQLAISNGPGKWGGLPGMILELEENDGDLTYKATEVSITDDEVLPTIPTDGKRVTSEEFDKIEAKKRKEMEEMYGTKSGNKGVIIIKN